MVGSGQIGPSLELEFDQLSHFLPSFFLLSLPEIKSSSSGASSKLSSVLLSDLGACIASSSMVWSTATSPPVTSSSLSESRETFSSSSRSQSDGPPSDSSSGPCSSISASNFWVAITLMQETALSACQHLLKLGLQQCSPLKLNSAPA